MKLLIALCCVAIVAARRHRRADEAMADVLASIPECVEAKQDNWQIANCPDLGACLEDAHKSLKECAGTRLAEPKFKECATKQLDDKKKNMKDACRWHNAVDKCMAGGQTPGSEWDDVVTASPTTANEPHEPHQPPSEEDKKHMGCMHDGYHKLKTCLTEKTASCTNWPVCAGREQPGATADDNLKKWHTITRHLKHTQKKDMKKYWQDMKACLTAAA